MCPKASFENEPISGQLVTVASRIGASPIPGLILHFPANGHVPSALWAF